MKVRDRRSEVPAVGNSKISHPIRSGQNVQGDEEGNGNNEG